MKMRQVKKIINKMVEEGTLTFWSSGSTTLYMLPGTQADLDKEEKGVIE
jgi:hypothetical protein